MPQAAYEDCSATPAERDRAGAALLAVVPDLVAAAESLAAAFAAGATLHVFADHDADAHHVAVEFMDPVIVGTPSLAACAFGLPYASRALRSATPGDIALGLCVSDPVRVAQALDLAAQHSLLTASITTSGQMTAGHVLVLPSADPLVARELQVTVVHLLWELTHVFLEPRLAPVPVEPS